MADDGVMPRNKGSSPFRRRQPPEIRERAVRDTDIGGSAMWPALVGLLAGGASVYAPARASEALDHHPASYGG